MKRLFGSSAILLILISITLAVAATPAGQAKKPPEIAPAPHFDRQQLMMLNLNRSKGSSGYYLADSVIKTHNMLKDLDRALNQMEQVEKTYAKYKGKPDNHYLEAPEQGIKDSMESAQKLEQQLKQTYQELKSSIQQALVAE